MTSPDKLILRIYDTVADPEHWQGVLDDIVTETGAVAANLFQGDSTHMELQSTWMSSRICDIFDKDENIAKIQSEQDLYAAIPLLLTEQELISEMVVGPMYERAGLPQLELEPLLAWLRKDYGIHHRLTSPLNRQPHYFDFFTLHYGEQFRGLAPPREWLDLGNSLLPHVAKAVEVNRPFVLLYKRFQATLDVLDRLHLGVIITGLNGQVWLSNASADQILERRDSLAISPKGALITSQAQDQGLLGVAIDRLTEEKPDSIKACRMRLSRAHSTDPYVVDLSLLRNSTLGSRGGGFQGVLVVIVDPDRPQLVNLDHVEDLFGLTPAETSICELVIKGHSNSEMAEIRNVSTETIITQLKSLFLKTNVHKRGELIHLAHSVNIPVDHPD